MIIPPPSLPGAVNEREALFIPEVAVSPVGAEGTVMAVVVVLVVAEGQPEPCVFKARSCTGYAVSGVSPVIKSGLAVDAGERVTQLMPPLMDYS